MNKRMYDEMIQRELAVLVREIAIRDIKDHENQNKSNLTGLLSIPVCCLECERLVLNNGCLLVQRDVYGKK